MFYLQNVYFNHQRYHNVNLLLYIVTNALIWYFIFIDNYVNNSI